jgi:hypothetical protein
LHTARITPAMNVPNILIYAPMLYVIVCVMV